jgi:DNA-binding response OmpR family regulator
MSKCANRDEKFIEVSDTKRDREPGLLHECIAARAVTILCVDDHPEMRGLLATFLRRKGYNVKEAGCGESAIIMMQNSDFDVVIADQNLSGELAGVEVLAYHNQVSRGGTRILFTAMFCDELRAMCQEINALYVSKPIPLDELVFKIEGS